MTLPTVFHEAAEAELNDAAAFYEQVEAGLGYAFLDDVDAALAAIQAHPEANETRYGRIRRRLLVRFPYALLYSFDGEQVRILAIAHQRRRPFYWRRRR